MASVRIARGSGGGSGVDDISCAAMVHLGCAATQGVEIHWVDARGGLAAMNAVLEGRADVAYGGFGPIVSLRAQGKPCRIFVSQARALAQALVTDKGIRRRAWWCARSASPKRTSAGSRSGRRRCASPLCWKAASAPRSSARRKRSCCSATTVRACRLLDFEELKRLVPLQPHGVLATTASYESAAPEVLRALARAMVSASRALHESFDNFRSTVRAYVKLELSDEELRLLWQREHDSRGWAVEGELSRAHWDAQLALYRTVDPAARGVTFDELITTRFL